MRADSSIILREPYNSGKCQIGLLRRAVCRDGEQGGGVYIRRPSRRRRPRDQRIKGERLFQLLPQIARRFLSRSQLGHTGDDACPLLLVHLAVRLGRRDHG